MRPVLHVVSMAGLLIALAVTIVVLRGVFTGGFADHRGTAIAAAAVALCSAPIFGAAAFATLNKTGSLLRSSTEMIVPVVLACTAVFYGIQPFLPYF